MARTRSTHDDAVLTILQNAATPLSAYQVLAALRDHGVQSPPVVYRALDRLEKAGSIHRVEQLNAYVACPGHQHDEPVVLAVCTECKRVAEWPAADVVARIDNQAREHGFRPSHKVIELQGLCAACALDLPAPAPRCGAGHDHD